jgi:hypothetical protein
MNHSDHFRPYQIRVEGLVRESWFEGVTLHQTPAGETVIDAELDQAALHGLLNQIRDLGLVLLSVQSDPTPAPISLAGAEGRPTLSNGETIHESTPDTKG